MLLINKSSRLSRSLHKPDTYGMLVCQALGAKIDGPETVSFNGLEGLELWPRITWTPLFALTWDDLEVESPALFGIHIIFGVTIRTAVQWHVIDRSVLMLAEQSQRCWR